MPWMKQEAISDQIKADSTVEVWQQHYACFWPQWLIFFLEWHLFHFENLFFFLTPAESIFWLNSTCS